MAELRTNPPTSAHLSLNFSMLLLLNIEKKSPGRKNSHNMLKKNQMEKSAPQMTSIIFTEKWKKTKSEQAMRCLLLRSLETLWKAFTFLFHASVIFFLFYDECTPLGS